MQDLFTNLELHPRTWAHPTFIGSAGLAIRQVTVRRNGHLESILVASFSRNAHSAVVDRYHSQYARQEFAKTSRNSGILEPV